MGDVTFLFPQTDLMTHKENVFFSVYVFNVFEIGSHVVQAGLKVPVC